MNLDLSGKNALVCGGSKGIGKATAIELSKLGANVTLLARDIEALGDAMEELHHTASQDHDFMVVDFENQADLKIKLLGLTTTKSIHILVNNTGGPAGGAIVDAKPEAFLQALNNHLICNQILLQYVLKGMKKDNYGRIINIISTSVKQPIPGLGVSNTTRGAVASWAKTLAGELGPLGITVNNVLPGFTATGRLDAICEARAKKNGTTKEEVAAQMKSSVPMRRFADPAEIGAGAAFLATPAASYINGTNLVIDGGRTGSL